MTGRVSRRGENKSRAGRDKARRSLYSKALDEADLLDFEMAQGIDGIDDEIALLRMKIKSLLENDPENMKMIMEAANTLARLVTTRYRITTDQKKALTNAIGNVLQGLAIPLGIKYLP